MPQEAIKLVSGRATARPQVPTSDLFPIPPCRRSWRQVSFLSFSFFNFYVVLNNLRNVYCLCFLIVGISQFPTSQVSLLVCLCSSLSASCRPRYQTLPDLEGSRVWEGKIMALDSAGGRRVVGSRRWDVEEGWEREQSRHSWGCLAWGLATVTLKQCFSKFSSPGLKINWSTWLKFRVLGPTSRLLPLQ